MQVFNLGLGILFVAVVPVAPAVVLGFSVLRNRLAAFHLTCVCRRPAPERSEDIGLWADAVSALCLLCVLSNAAVYVFTCNGLEDLDWRLKLVAYMAIVQVVWALQQLVDVSEFIHEIINYSRVIVLVVLPR